jgi:hypothetical protein
MWHIVVKQIIERDFEEPPSLMNSGESAPSKDEAFFLAFVEILESFVTEKGKEDDTDEIEKWATDALEKFESIKKKPHSSEMKEIVPKLFGVFQRALNSGYYEWSESNTHKGDESKDDESEDGESEDDDIKEQRKRFEEFKNSLDTSKNWDDAILRASAFVTDETQGEDFDAPWYTSEEIPPQDSNKVVVMYSKGPGLGLARVLLPEGDDTLEKTEELAFFLAANSNVIQYLHTFKEMHVADLDKLEDVQFLDGAHSGQGQYSQVKVDLSGVGAERLEKAKFVFKFLMGKAEKGRLAETILADEKFLEPETAESHMANISYSKEDQFPTLLTYHFVVLGVQGLQSSATPEVLQSSHSRAPASKRQRRD